MPLESWVFQAGVASCLVIASQRIIEQLRATLHLQNGVGWKACALLLSAQRLHFVRAVLLLCNDKTAECAAGGFQCVTSLLTFLQKCCPQY